MLDDSCSIDAYFLPALFQPEEITGKTAVVFDVLRATSVMIEALANGAVKIIPCASIEEANQVRNEINHDTQTLLGGERNGLKIDGFDIGNSPVEVNADTVSGKTMVMTTTNGTVAIAHCRFAQQILIGSLFNVSAIAKQLTRSKKVALVCAGTGGEITGEDVLAAGAVIETMLDVSGDAFQLNDQAQIARSMWTQLRSSGQSVVSALRKSKGGRNLLRHGKDRFELDIEISAEIDRHDFVPALNGSKEITKPANNVAI